MLEVRNLSFAYSRRPVFEDVSFSVAAGETVALVGPNGAGKTTLLRVLAGLQFPLSGCVFADGSDVFAHPMRYRRVLGYLPESVALDGDLSVKAYLKFRARLRGEQPRKIRHRVSEAIERCGLEDSADRRIGLLSFGHRRRVALADALLLRPRYLLADDPFAGFDPPSREVVASVLGSMADFTSVVVTGHEFASLAVCAKRFLVLKDAHVTEAASAREAEEAVK